MPDTKISALAAVTDVQATDELVLARAGATKKIDASDLLMFDAYAYLRDEKAAGTAGGAATTGSFQTRTLQTEVFDPSGIVSLSSNQFTLGAGTYWIIARVPMFRTQNTKVKVLNVTDTSDAIIGTNGFSTSDGLLLVAAGRVTIGGSKAFAVQYRCSSNDAGNTNCLGIAANFAVVEVYTEVEIWREVA